MAAERRAAASLSPQSRSRKANAGAQLAVSFHSVRGLGLCHSHSGWVIPPSLKPGYTHV